MMAPASPFAFLLLDDEGRARHRLGDMDWRDIVERALQLNCRALALEQRRLPMVPPVPSLHDIIVTRIVHRHLRPIGITLADHVIRTDTSAFSFRANGLL